MKKFYLLFTLLTVLFSYGQGTPVITMIADGDESGGTPKVVEIYANGTVDFANYTLQKAPNGGNWGNDFDLSPLGTVTDAFVYVYSNGSNTNDPFAANFPSVTANALDAGSAQAVNFNGDDPIRIIETATSAVVDVFGDGDGTGTPWEYKDGYAKRINGTGPDAAFNVANWDAQNGALDGHGAGADGTTYESIIGLGTYTPPTTLVPSLTITAPTDNQVFSPSTTSVDVVYTVQNFNVAQTGGDGYIQYNVNGAGFVDQYTTDPITISGLTPQSSVTVEMKLVDNNGNDLSPAVSDTVTFEIADYTQVATLAELRGSALDAYYHFTGEAFLTAFKVNTSGSVVAYLQDATAAIAVYVPADLAPATPPTLYDGVTDIKGELTDFHSMLEINLTDNFTPTLNNQPVTPQVVTIADYLSNQDNYEAELIKIENVTIDPDGDTTFQANHSYSISDGTDNLTLRTAFPAIENETIPTDVVNVTGIGGQYNQYLQIMPRDINDIEVVNAINTNNIDGLQVYPNPVTGKMVYVSSNNDVNKQITLYNVLGKVVLSTETNNNQMIDLSALKAGVYMMKIEENGHIAVEKLMIK